MLRLLIELNEKGTFQLQEQIEHNTTEQPREFIHIDIAYHQLYHELRKNREDENHAPFREMKHIFMLAVLIGYLEEKWVPLEKSQQNIFARTTLKEDDILLLRALAIAKTGNPKVLTNEKEIQSIAEGYANGGIAVIKQQIEDTPGNRVDNIVDMLLNWEPYKSIISSD